MKERGTEGRKGNGQCCQKNPPLIHVSQGFKQKKKNRDWGVENGGDGKG